MSKNNNNEQDWQVLVLLLKEVAKERNINQEQLADMTDLKQSSISRLFGLKFCPNMRTYLAVAKALELNVFFEPRDSKTDLSLAFERAMDELGRRSDALSKN